MSELTARFGVIHEPVGHSIEALSAGGRLATIDDQNIGQLPDLEERLLAFHGIGPVTANIFLRELRPFWAKSDTAPLDSVEDAANQLGIDLDRYDRTSLTFARVEAGLIRWRHSGGAGTEDP